MNKFDYNFKGFPGNDKFQDRPKCLLHIPFSPMPNGFFYSKKYFTFKYFY